jgi:hypothetical protein
MKHRVWWTLALAGGGVESLSLRTAIGHARVPAERGATGALTPPAYAFASLRAAVGAAATVALASLQVDAPASTASLLRTTTVAAAATVALVGLEVYAPVVTSALPLGASVVGPGHPRDCEAKAAPTRAPPINLIALARVTLPSASPLASSSKKLSSLAIGRAPSHIGRD